ncbi:hypothetical protein HF908_21325 (plasmid) [Ralstonia pseudosolanacearum]|uniref:hypothetical protein n=1 Tax=Ralstonia pseudosolanacearum TaxID=1310165 RepID=UPI001868A149|nr:hypothetical protein [Ralstonia pseudosolanacearum]QOK94007.1 hypothetical protein HF908_21325 [Ralstonia pseudosolanacearum]
MRRFKARLWSSQTSTEGRVPEGGNRRQAQRFSEKKPSGKAQFFVDAAGILLSLVKSSKRSANRGPELYEILCHLRNAVRCSKAGQHVGGVMFLFLNVDCLMAASDLWWGGLVPFFLLSFAVDLICVIRLVMRLSIVSSLCLIAN